MIPKKVGVLSGAFNPVTRAHLALVDAALTLVDEAICVVPRIYPHKKLQGASIQDRADMLRRAGGHYHVHVSERGLFNDIAQELLLIRPEAELLFHLRKRRRRALFDLGLRRSRCGGTDASSSSSCWWPLVKASTFRPSTSGIECMALLFHTPSTRSHRPRSAGALPRARNGNTWYQHPSLSWCARSIALRRPDARRARPFPCSLLVKRIIRR